MSIGYFYYFNLTEPFLVLSELIIYSLIPVIKEVGPAWKDTCRGKKRKRKMIRSMRQREKQTAASADLWTSVHRARCIKKLRH